MYKTFVNNSKAQIYREFREKNSEWDELDELKEFKNVSAWYNK